MPNWPQYTWEQLTDAPWLERFRDVPHDIAAVPSAMSPPHPDATGSLGPVVRDWAKDELGITLRWWQDLAITRQLEYADDPEGVPHPETGQPIRLVWRQIIESTPRRAGKSSRMKVVALWRIQQRSMFGEAQLALHTGSNLAICIEILRQAFPWADEQGFTTRRGTGAESIETPDGGRWIVRGQTSTLGYDVTLGIVDEAWDVPSLVVDDNMEPSLMERVQPQMLITSTAHRKATSLMRRRFHAALRGLGEDRRTLLLWWGSPAGVDITDRAVWRASNPHWSRDREELMTDKYDRALRGEADPEFDDLDPMEAFSTQYLNMWPDPNTPRDTGDPVVTGEEWDARAMAVPEESRPTAQALESWYGEGVSVASAHVLPSGDIVVAVEQYADLPTAAATLDPEAHVITGKSLANDPSLSDRAEGKALTSRLAVVTLRRMIDDGVFFHDGSPDLRGQVTTVRVKKGPDGPVLRSTSRVDAIKAAVWAVEWTRSAFEDPAVF